MDRWLVQGWNRWAAASAFRADTTRTLAVLPLIVIVGLVVFAWLADWGRAPERRAILVVGLLGTALGLIINVALGHLYYRPRPFVVLPVHPLLPQAPDSSLYSDQLVVAGALTAALLVARPRLGAIAAALTCILGAARVAAGVHYPSDVVVGALAGAVCFALLLPLRTPVARLISVMATGEAAAVGRQRAEGNFVFRHGVVVGVGLLLAAASLAYGIRALQDHGRIEAGARAAARLAGPDQTTPPDVYSGTSIAAIASGGYRATHAAFTGNVTQVTRELDGDIHIRIEGPGAFIVAEIIPELPLPPPHVGQVITAWGIVRHDGLHNWWELHPLIGWTPGATAVTGSPGPGTGD